MNKKPLDITKLRSLLRFDAETGLFYWLQDRRGGARAGDKAGTMRPDGYVQIRCDGMLYLAHHLAWVFEHGAWPTNIDHVDGRRENNRPHNLRDVSVGLNMENQKRAQRSNRSSGLLGVTFCKKTGRWMAKISISDRTHNLGRFDTKEAAHAAYLDAKRLHHKGNTL